MSIYSTEGNTAAADLATEAMIKSVDTKHNYSANDQETGAVCNPGDKECLSRLVAAFGDCA